VLQRRPNTFAQTNLLSQFFACDKAADHTFRFADRPQKPNSVGSKESPLFRVAESSGNGIVSLPPQFGLLNAALWLLFRSKD